MRLENKVAIVTGGAGGIGQGIVKKFLDEGAKVLVVDVIPQADGDTLIAELATGRGAAYLQKDISVEANAAAIIAKALEHFGKLDVLVNNAHASKQAPIMDTTQEMWDLSFGTGMYATYNLMRAAHPELKKTQGSIVNFASGAGIKGLPNQVTYAAAKEAIRAISRVAAHEWAADGIRVNLVSPVALTPGIQQWAAAYPAEYQKVVDGVPLGRLGDPKDDIAPVVAFLASDDARYLTGQTLMTDGGSTMSA
ncbi:SDR family NAD(P)-dependent oxidoreductase [Microbacterium sp. NC79]|uniref:SDR family NAD(P)-dependent oxidoreductase n=1 Tax=Microbacterium sp. NC79 TaxID=2851009 RepID=UPI001C2B9697|nr:SDR family oxidoreductase [Microbacterium sp. NC79]MBV0895347.1 SDR family oxidoreductase [Microbacterium sp. NC79]